MTKPTGLDELVHRIASEDDPAAYRTLFELYYERLSRFAYTILHTKESAEEIVSDLFLKLWINRKTLTSIENKHLYLYISIKNLCINQLSKEKRNRVFPLEDCKVDIKSIYFDPEQLMITAEMIKRIQQAIRQLPPRCQIIFKLIKEDGLKYREAAELLGLSEKTIENQMTIALRKIDEYIQFDIVRSVSS